VITTRVKLSGFTPEISRKVVDRRVYDTPKKGVAFEAKVIIKMSRSSESV
jgi:hypothetical protein